MATFQISRLFSGQDGKLDEAARVMEKAMADDGMTLTLIGGDRTKAFAMHRSTLGAAALAGEIHLCHHQRAGLVGVAMWFPPGQELFSSQEQRDAGFTQLFQTFPEQLQQWWINNFLPTYAVVPVRALGEGVKTSAWHLQMIGVLPEHQGKGAGSALVRPVLEKAESQGQNVCLETNVLRNVSLYEHWGLSVQGEESFDSTTGGFHVWVMLKRPIAPLRVA
ncbi:hypothetical protein OE88DRAFT_788039 [Heliocybe sulcata]|uniref:N-acetyltransferase domain-containing protein n=1 Tax=Heliocybe sulcata TaxID=5364 RepID=A0A5C3MQW1_9AGAM|nr:hypothetical protein OE88DRAFT_788039 [Heliocybe sulcata]